MKVCAAVASVSTALTESQREIETVAGTNLSPVCSWMVVVLPLTPAHETLVGLGAGRCDGEAERVGDVPCVAGGVVAEGRADVGTDEALEVGVRVGVAVGADELRAW